MAGEDKAYLSKKEASTVGGSLLLYSNLLEEARTLEESGMALVEAELRAHGLEKEMWMYDNVPRAAHQEVSKDGPLVKQKQQHPRRHEAHAAKPRVIERLKTAAADAQTAAADLRQPQVFHQGADHWELKGRPVLDVEIFAGLCYTGSDAQGEIRKALRQPVSQMDSAESWRWLLTALRHLIIKLAEEPPPLLYHGLNNVATPSKDTVFHHRARSEEEGRGKAWVSYNNFVSGSMDLDVACSFAMGEVTVKGTAPPVGTVLHFDMSQSNGGDGCGWPSVLAADMRWLSKFADEKEWLMIPCSTFGGVMIWQTKSEPLCHGGELIHQDCRWTT